MNNKMKELRNRIKDYLIQNEISNGSLIHVHVGTKVLYECGIDIDLDCTVIEGVVVYFMYNPEIHDIEIIKRMVK